MNHEKIAFEFGHMLAVHICNGTEKMTRGQLTASFFSLAETLAARNKNANRRGLYLAGIARDGFDAFSKQKGMPRYAEYK